mmetsp:Transcript_15526/g.49516  ORF Transcript_15526/g.49516 Transcript_15526/m.49516 type:complete len:242 (-) Transcript_15526:377-1102(-)
MAKGNSIRRTRLMQLVVAVNGADLLWEAIFTHVVVAVQQRDSRGSKKLAVLRVLLLLLHLLVELRDRHPVQVLDERADGKAMAADQDVLALLEQWDNAALVVGHNAVVHVFRALAVLAREGRLEVVAHLGEKLRGVPSLVLRGRHALELAKVPLVELVGADDREDLFAGELAHGAKACVNVAVAVEDDGRAERLVLAEADHRGLRGAREIGREDHVQWDAGEPLPRLEGLPDPGLGQRHIG